MVRVPGSSGDSQGFHRENTEEDVKIKTEPGNELSTKEESPPTTSKTPGSSDRQSDGGALTTRTRRDEDPTVKTEGSSSNKTPPSSHSASKKKESKTARRKLKAPGSEAGDREEPQAWTDGQLESAFHYMKASDMLDAVKILMRMLKDAGIVLGSFDANNLFDMEQSVIRETTLNRFARLAPMVGSLVPVPQEVSTPTLSQAGSSQYASATLEAGSGSDSSIDLQRMTLGPSGATMLRSRKEVPETNATPSPVPVHTTPSCMQSFFDTAMERFLKEQQQASSNLLAAAPGPADSKLSGAQNLDMKSVGSAHSHLSNDWKGLAKSFQTQYFGRGVSVARQYYHARKRSDDSPLESLYRLNVAGLRAQLSIKDGSTEARREPVDHFIETLEDRDLVNQLALLRIPEADTLEETL
ncbi:unnamed protein product [Phytophthora fragariaefolia]|uniref:Unnamed protein product n=1 Tax=Phytophthora fragariaefolia TaxID=1490495 RepID=A0A9W6XU93_9STRA|nr:unnamed protein product [Phytophthora fragariaefolia]